MVKMPLRSIYSLVSVKVWLIMPNFLFTQLVPGYRGYVVDSLRNLSYLDDVNISADEKHHFKGLSKRKGKLIYWEYATKIHHLFISSSIILTDKNGLLWVIHGTWTLTENITVIFKEQKLQLLLVLKVRNVCDAQQHAFRDFKLSWKSQKHVFYYNGNFR